MAKPVLGKVVGKVVAAAKNLGQAPRAALLKLVQKHAGKIFQSMKPARSGIKSVLNKLSRADKKSIVDKLASAAAQGGAPPDLGLIQDKLAPAAALWVKRHAPAVVEAVKKQLPKRLKGLLDKLRPADVKKLAGVVAGWVKKNTPVVTVWVKNNWPAVRKWVRRTAARFKALEARFKDRFQHSGFWTHLQRFLQQLSPQLVGLVEEVLPLVGNATVNELSAKLLALPAQQQEAVLRMVELQQQELALLNITSYNAMLSSGRTVKAWHKMRQLFRNVSDQWTALASTTACKQSVNCIKLAQRHAAQLASLDRELFVPAADVPATIAGLVVSALGLLAITTLLVLAAVWRTLRKFSMPTMAAMLLMFCMLVILVARFAMRLRGYIESTIIIYKLLDCSADCVVLCILLLLAWQWSKVASELSMTHGRRMWQVFRWSAAALVAVAVCNYLVAATINSLSIVGAIQDVDLHNTDWLVGTGVQFLISSAMLGLSLYAYLEGTRTKNELVGPGL